MKNLKKLTAMTVLAIMSAVNISVYANPNNPSLAIMYHEICTNKKDETAFIITASAFENDIKYLKDSGYQFLFASEMEDYLNNSDGKNAVAITFDDGYETGLTTVLPILEKYEVKATFFVIGNDIDKPQFMTKEQLKTLSESPYVEIGNHSNNIHGMPADSVSAMYSRDAMAALDDFNNNSEILESIISKKITSASYPYGIYTDYLNALMNYNGYTTYSSVEMPCIKETTPYPRYNRPGDAEIAALISHAAANSYYNPPANYRNPHMQQQAGNNITVYENGSKFQGNVISKDGTTMLPVSFIAENLNASAEFNNYGRSVRISKNGKLIELNSDSDTALINGEPTSMGNSAFLYAGTLYAPVRFVAEAIGAQVKWDGKHKTVIIY